MERYWTKKKAKLKQKFSGITDKDLVYQMGKELEMVEKLSKKIGKSAKEVLSIIIEF